jgi:2-polyprenyl-6-hydroxyphenyl methylase/3-demethylubiquinone-9 3-methyltransferase
MDFGRLSDEWWNPTGPMRPLHALNPVRIEYIKQQLGGDLAGKTILDAGCGGGLVCEPLARLRANVTGIDLSPDLITVAKDHAAQSGLDITYDATPLQSLDQTFDAVLVLEVVEHLDDPATFIRDAAARVKPGGTMVLSTLNRTLKSLALGKFAAEYVLRWVPPGTHDWKMFLKPSELVAHCEAAGLKAVDLCGLVYDPVRNRFSLDKSDLEINYFLTCRKET